MTTHRIAQTVAASVAASVLALTASASAASAATGRPVQSPHVPDFSFAACPAVTELPAGSDPAAWRCEVMLATGHLKIGSVDRPIVEPMSITFAEGRTDGEFRQVFSEMKASPIRIPHTPWTITPQYGGYSDFLSNDERRGEIDLKFALDGPGLPRDCAIGSDKNAVRVVLKDTEPTRVISKEPLVVTFGARDGEFAAPATSGCGPIGRVLDMFLGLPSPAGGNILDLDATVGIRPYA